MRTYEYRVVSLLLDPIIRTMVPIGAVARDEDGWCISAPAKYIPDARCLGGAEIWHQADYLRSQLDKVEFDSVPRLLGPLVSLGRVLVTPPIDDPLAWLQRLLPQELQGRNSGHRRMHLSTRGYKFFETHSVDNYVKKRFHAKQFWLKSHPKLANSVGLLDGISHYSKGDGRLLLMEPIWLLRDQLEKDLGTVAQRFSAYRYHLKDHLRDSNVDLIAYVTSGGRPDIRRDAIEQLQQGGSADWIVDTHDRRERARFVDLIRDVGSSVQGMLH